MKRLPRARSERRDSGGPVASVADDRLFMVFALERRATAGHHHPGKRTDYLTRKRRPEMDQARRAQATESSEVLYELDDGIAVVTLNAPERMNTISRAMLGQLTDCWPPTPTRRSGW